MPSELCTGNYNLQCYPQNDPGVPFSVQVSASGTHRTTGYQALFVRVDDEAGLPVLAFRHERTKQPDLEMMTIFEVAFAFESSTNVKKVKIIDAKKEHIVTAQNVPTLIATCLA
jgi:hypothetical protein